jgi:hypothetical protein
VLDPLTVLHERTDAVAAHWEKIEADREAESVKFDSERSLLAQFPHKPVSEPVTPGFCRCGWPRDHSIHSKGKLDA